jgi:hypothetical protein
MSRENSHQPDNSAEAAHHMNIERGGLGVFEPTLELGLEGA